MIRRLFQLLLGLATLGLAAALNAAPAIPAVAARPGTVTFGTDRFVEQLHGDLPVVLTSPHGGRLKPASIRDRTEGVRDMDANTQELARAIAAEFLRRTGHHVHLVASHLHRGKLDPNREIKEAAQGDPLAERTWQEYHAAIRGALSDAVAAHGFAFLVDLHGHGHPIARLELGYALDAKQLNQTDAALDASGLIALSTLSDLHARGGGAPSALLRGPGSLGDLFNQAGVRATPSPRDPQPGDHPFFAGGYTVRVHAAAPETTKVDGLQIECHRIGIRDTAESRDRFARITADVLTRFLEARYPYRFPAAPR